MPTELQFTYIGGPTSLMELGGGLQRAYVETVNVKNRRYKGYFRVSGKVRGRGRVCG